jgi:chromosome segregation ATPase
MLIVVSWLTSIADPSDSVFSRDLQGFKAGMEARMDTMEKILTILHDDLKKETSDRKIFQKDHDRTVMDLTCVKGRVGSLHEKVTPLDEKMDDLEAQVRDLAKQSSLNANNAASSTDTALLTQQLKDLKDELAEVKLRSGAALGHDNSVVAKLDAGSGTSDAAIANAMVCIGQNSPYML